MAQENKRILLLLCGVLACKTVFSILLLKCPDHSNALSYVSCATQPLGALAEGIYSETVSATALKTKESSPSNKSKSVNKLGTNTIKLTGLADVIELAVRLEIHHFHCLLQ